MANRNMNTFKKREREEAKRRKRLAKEAKREQRQSMKALREPTAADIDPDIAHIVPGPQPRQDD